VYWDSFPVLLAHELRNPLSGICAHIEVLKELFDSHDPRLESLLSIEREIERINEIIQKILEFSRTGNITKKTIDFKEFLTEWWDTQIRKYKKQNINFELKIKGQIGKVQIDRRLIERVFDNIIDNSVYAIGNEKGEIKVSVYREKEYINIQFKDTGKGIPKENLKRIFDPFFTTSAKGMGLGLAISKRIIEAHNGKINVISNINKGTTFLVKLTAEKESRTNDSCSDCG